MTTTYSPKDSYRCRKQLQAGGKTYHYMDLKEAEANGLAGVSKLPRSLKVLLENLLRNEDGTSVTKTDIEAFAKWAASKSNRHEIAYRPARVLMQDFTGVPAVVDLAAMREAMHRLGGDPKAINPLSPVDLVIDHSVSVDHFASDNAFEKNVEVEFERNKERYTFLRWAQDAFDNFRVVPPGTGICHQVNLEYLAQVAWTKDAEGESWVYPDTLVGTDSHTTMVNGLGVLGWGVGGIEAEAAMLAQPVTMLIPDVVGFELTGELVDGVTATDLVLRIVELLRQKGVVGKFVEFYGSGLKKLTLADRATIANMAPEYGATCGFFPVDEETVSYLSFTGREKDRVELAEAYSKAQGLWLEEGQTPVFTDTLSLDLGSIEAAIAGPKRPQDRIALSSAPAAFGESMNGLFKSSQRSSEKFTVEGKDHGLKNGDVVIAAITSCTNTSNPAVMMAAGLVAKKANALGLKVQPWVKTSLAPGSQVVTDYLKAANLQSELDNLGFNLVGYGCTTCIGNSGPLEAPYSKVINDKDLVVTSMLSGNRNFEGRISPDIKANYLASPPLVVVYALAGTLLTDFEKDAIGKDKDGNDVFLKDVWPSTEEVRTVMSESLTPEMFRSRYADVFKGPKKWQDIPTSDGFLYDWDDASTYVKHPPFFQTMTKDVEKIKDISSARILAKLGDSVTTDHISPAGAIGPDSSAGEYLQDKKVERRMFNSFGSRRGNHEVMMRGTFGNIRIRNELVPGVEGGYTKHLESGEQMSIYDAAMRYQNEGHDLVVIAGKEYGTGSSRDWAAKGTYLQGVKAVIAESYERIHRSNLIGMGVMPLEFTGGASRTSLNLKGDEEFTMQGLEQSLKAGGKVGCTIKRADGSEEKVDLQCRIDTEDELSYFKHGGILNFVIRRLL